MQNNSVSEEGDDHIAAINIIPLVDVVLVLLIIFMVTTVFSKDSALKIDLPKGSRAEQPKAPPTTITVSVDSNSNIYINERQIQLKDLNNEILALRGKNDDTILLLRGDAHVMYGTIMPVLDEISHTGINLTLALKPGTDH